MLVVPKEELKRRHEETKKGLVDEYDRQMENIINENAKYDKYWILGKVKFPEEFGGVVGKTFLQACLEKPPLVKDAFLYEVDNRKGTKTLLWVMHPGGKLRLPTLNKTVQVTQSGEIKS